MISRLRGLGFVLALIGVVFVAAGAFAFMKMFPSQKLLALIASYHTCRVGKKHCPAPVMPSVWIPQAAAFVAKRHLVSPDER